MTGKRRCLKTCLQVFGYEKEQIAVILGEKEPVKRPQKKNAKSYTEKEAIAIFLKLYPQYTLDQVYRELNLTQVMIMIKASSSLDYDKQVFDAKIRGYEIKEEYQPKPMTKEDWKLAFKEIARQKARFDRDKRIIELNRRR